MCDTCGCNITSGNRHLLQPAGKLEKTADGKSAVTVLQSLLSENDHQALHNRQHFDQHGVLAINLMSSPGSGKTALLEATIDALAERYRIAVIEGDLETENDAERIRARGVTAIQIATGSACHLDAHMVHDALHQLNLADYDLIFIENVGNLVCPASFDLGHHHNITLLSVTEGDDKPAKYPVMFRAADLMLLTKTDLLAVLDDFDPQKAEHCLRQLANPAPMLSLSATRQQGMAAWFDWLDNALASHKQRLEQGETVMPKIQADGAWLHAGEAAHP
ncbi:MAG: hydrogenase nickel incorporation protein HypB [Thiohalophilus sp.]|uniref:hydrogenase nickel incorporation protein HypB n=1 Tax=Thiohalophilus sp. TaxID=3028392 RepID=UPI0028706478|nr:hydrogenase nickel incorporation protein HypB [Thiohalophilus sp.]MDR9435802.1 hydrogenase nickel incorporation protein HypB [Thiohalophilus sp.]